MKKRISIVFLFVIIVTLAACGKQNNKYTQLGTSKFFIELPDGYKSSSDDFDEDQVAYYHKDDKSIDFDVYQWGKEGIYNLEEEANYFAEEYDTTAYEIVINEIPGMKYESQEEYDGYTYTVINYMFDDGENIVELCFWTINTEEELAAVEEIINSIIIK